ncbi:hypothetical protein [Levilactobacillus acidifarinae]|uniref:UBA domain-containing protein n=1 Tax=Levilactobacillus acidifarinae DSM 19394 = JCM 15949 TaxID=1423715 RepID=A0A0R1LLH1_9LACO|nr:hypothetical protein [Levilactobacillus acidifarinae]KRK96748.1 hypothetical protein FD25_GL001673 [Levilactobacillus acidifarinae DSM 19394]GEO69885.1 AbrB family transcriptional regulator [Levilactobacillus acidifarinae]
METTKARKQGNAIVLTVPKSFNIKVGTVVKPRLTSEGIFYEFVDEDDFFDFDEEILQDLVDQGYQGQKLIEEFKAMKKKIPAAMDKLITQAAQAPTLTKAEAAKQIGL